MEKITVTGAVQGIGYRPFVKRLADELGLTGCVKNSGGIVTIFASAETDDGLAAFCRALYERAPAGAMILGVERSTPSSEELDELASVKGFTIEESTQTLSGDLPVFVPDLAACGECIAEMRDPKDRRYRYPLISCASCGPRYSILHAFPYDRERTTMRPFVMCDACAAEYAADKKERRRHAQTISCHQCGPQMRFLSEGNETTARALEEAERFLGEGGVIGLKGIGGFQLLADPRCEEAVRRIRELKGRETKPFAVMFPSIEAIKELCTVSEAEARVLASPARPILLLTPARGTEGSDDRSPAGWSASVLGDSAFIGAFLPASGVHQLLADACGPLVATSANRSGEPMIIREEELISRFINCGKENAGLDGVLTHPRRILAPVDDSVGFVDDDGDLSMIRRARGYVPLPVFARSAGLCGGAPGAGSAGDILAFGADMKAAFALARGTSVVVSQPFGDLEDLSVRRAYLAELERLTGIYDLHPARLVCDAHPSYQSAKLAREYAARNGLEAPVEIYHHHAHALSVMAQSDLTSCVAIVCDGTGYGPDGTVWGGEVLICGAGKNEETGIPGFTRAWHLPAFRLIGGDQASKNAELTAASLMLTMERSLEPLHLPEEKERLIRGACEAGAGVVTTSAGRLFDAVACILAISRENRYEGECAQKLEAAAHRWLRKTRQTETAPQHGISLSAYLQRLTAGEWDRALPGREAFLFHAALADALVSAAAAAAESAREKNIVLSGGCFANRILLQLVREGLRRSGLAVYTGAQLPSGDDGIPAGQAYALMI